MKHYMDAKKTTETLRQRKHRQFSRSHGRGGQVVGSKNLEWGRENVLNIASTPTRKEGWSKKNGKQKDKIVAAQGGKLKH